MSKEFFDAVKAIEAEKGIPAEYLYPVPGACLFGRQRLHGENSICHG